MELRPLKKENVNAEKTIKELTKNKSDAKQSIHKDHRSRLKNQFIQNGIDALTDVQKLELLLFFIK